ncbi:MAG: MFS transporter [Deltaproteobacteria bacterium]|nr:MFS transporter [Deltaproteobacteria bacterium]
MTDNFDYRTYLRLLCICCAVVFGCYFGTYMRMPVVPLYAVTLGADTVEVGLINAAFLLTAGVLSLPLGLFSDRLGTKRIAAIGILILSASSFLVALSRTPQQLIWIYLFSGVGLAAFGPTIMAFVANISPITHLGRSYGWYTTALYCGMTLGPAMGGFVAQGAGFTLTFFISGLSIFLTFWVLIFFLPGTGAGPPRQTAQAGTTLAMVGQLLRNRPLLGCWLGTLGGCFGLGLFLTFLPLHAKDQGLSVGQIGLVFATQGIVNALSRIPFGNLSDRVSNRNWLAVAGLLGVAGSIAAFGLADRIGYFILCAAALGASMGLAFTSIGALTAEAAPPEFRGLAMGGYNAAIYLGMMLSSALMGPVIRSLGFTDGFLLTGLINLILLAGFYLLIRDFSSRLKQPVS